MRNRSQKMSPTDFAVLDAISKFPGLTPLELHKHTQGMKESTMSAITSRLIHFKHVNRVKVPMTSTYRYYPRGAELPKGYTQWDNAVVQHVRKGNGPMVPAQTPPTNDLFNVAQDFAIAKALESKPIDKLSIRSDDVLITIPIGAKESMTLTIEQARKVWLQLNAIFGNK